MTYKNAKDILPTDLLRQLQKYIQGETLYIPKRENELIGWGHKNGTKQLIQSRNNNIYALHKSGCSISELSSNYHLSESSVRKIIGKVKQEALDKIDQAG